MPTAEYKLVGSVCALSWIENSRSCFSGFFHSTQTRPSRRLIEQQTSPFTFGLTFILVFYGQLGRSARRQSIRRRLVVCLLTALNLSIFPEGPIHARRPSQQLSLQSLSRLSGPDITPQSRTLISYVYTETFFGKKNLLPIDDPHTTYFQNDGCDTTGSTHFGCHLVRVTNWTWP